MAKSKPDGQTNSLAKKKHLKHKTNKIDEITMDEKYDDVEKDTLTTDLQTQFVDDVNKKRKVAVVVYENPAKRKRQTPTQPTTTKTDDKKGKSPGLSMSQVKNDIRRFAISHMGAGEGRDEAMSRFLIEKGAKPPKNKCINYKELTKSRIQAKKETQEQLEMSIQKGEARQKRRRPDRKREQNDVGLRAAQVGRFRDGVLQLSKRDVSRIMATKITR